MQDLDNIIMYNTSVGFDKEYSKPSDEKHFYKMRGGSYTSTKKIILLK